MCIKICWCNAKRYSIRLNSRVHRYTLSNSDVIFTVWQCKQGSCVFVKAYSTLKVRRGLHIEDFQRPDTSRPYDALCFTKENSFCGFSTIDVGLALV